MTAKPFEHIPLRRPNYFPGQYLLETDFEEQHKYLNARQKYHCQSLYVSGVMEGLTVERIAGQRQVRVAPGTAINERGNLIVLAQERIVPLQADNLGEQQLFIQFNEQEDLKTQQDKDNPESFTRFEETAEISVAASTPTGAVRLATLSLSDTEVSVSLTTRQVSGLRLPSPGGNVVLRYQGDHQTLAGDTAETAFLSGHLRVQNSLSVSGNSTLTGMVGIGNSNPSYNLHLGDPNQTSAPKLAISGRGTVGGNNHWRTWTLGTGTGNTKEEIHKLRIRDETGSVNGEERLVIDEQGNVGIGESSPTTKLHVNGTIKATSFEGSGASLTGLTGSQIQDSSITNTKLAVDSVDASKIQNGSVGQAKLADSSVVEGKIVNNAVTTQKLVDNTVTTAKIANNAVTEAKLADNAVTTNKLAFSARSQWISGTNSALFYTIGNVGIGTTTPSTKLHIEGGVLSVTSKDSSNNTWGLHIEVGGQPNASRIGVSQIKATTSGLGTGIQNIELLPQGRGTGLSYQAGQVIVGKSEVGKKANLTVNGLITADDIIVGGQSVDEFGRWRSGDNNQSIYFSNGSNNRVGIGTDNPTLTLSIGQGETGLQYRPNGELSICSRNKPRIKIDSVGNFQVLTEKDITEVVYGFEHDEIDHTPSGFETTAYEALGATTIDQVLQLIKKDVPDQVSTLPGTGWRVNKYENQICLKAPVLSPISFAILDLKAQSCSTIRFQYKGYLNAPSFLKFFCKNSSTSTYEEKLTTTGSTSSSWQDFALSLPSGIYDFRWVYVKSRSIGSQESDIFIKQIKIAAPGSSVMISANNQEIIFGEQNVKSNLIVNGNLRVTGQIQGKIWYSQEYEWSNGMSKVKMGHSSKCIAFLTYVQGKFAGHGEQVFVTIDSDGFWYLDGKQGADGNHIKAKARCIGIPF